MSLPPMGVTIYGRPQGGTPGAPASLQLVVHHPGGGQIPYRVNLWDHGDQLAHDAVHNRDQTARGMLADWVDDNQDALQAIPQEYRPYVGQLIRRGHRWPPEPPTPIGHERLSRRRVQVRRYSATEGDVHNLLHQLGTNPEHRQPGSVLRGVAADALQEQGRDREADVLRNHPHPVYVVSGKVRRTYPIPQVHRTTAMEWHGGGSSALYGIGSSGRTDGQFARRALSEIDHARMNSPDLQDPNQRRPLDRLYDHLSQIERETADEQEDEPEYLYHRRTPRRYAAYRAPAGNGPEGAKSPGIIGWGTAQKGGTFMPDPRGAFAQSLRKLANPPPTKARVVKPRKPTQPLKMAEGQEQVNPTVSFSPPDDVRAKVKKWVWRNRVRKLSQIPKST